jgi:hypothetical protein
VSPAASSQTIVYLQRSPAAPQHKLVICGKEEGAHGYVLRHILSPPEGCEFEPILVVNDGFAAVAANTSGALQDGVLLYDVRDGSLFRRIHLPTALEQTWIPQATDRILYIRLTEAHLLVCYVTGVLLVPLAGESPSPASAEGTYIRDPTRAFAFPSRSMAMDAAETMLQIAPRVSPITRRPDDNVPPRASANTTFALSFVADKATVLPGADVLVRATIMPPRVTRRANSTAVVMWSDSPTAQRFNAGQFSLPNLQSLQLSC